MLLILLAMSTERHPCDNIITLALMDWVMVHWHQDVINLYLAADGNISVAA